MVSSKVNTRGDYAKPPSEAPTFASKKLVFSIFDVLIQFDHMHISDENFTSGSVWEVHDNARLNETTPRPKNNAALVDCNFRNVKCVYKCSPQHPLYVNSPNYPRLSSQ